MGIPPNPRPKDEAVNPQHYAALGEYAASHVIRAWDRHRKASGLEPVSFDVGNALKYMQRAGTKPGESELTDILKAIWYLQERAHVLDPSQPDPAA